MGDEVFGYLGIKKSTVDSIQQKWREAKHLPDTVIKESNEKAKPYSERVLNQVSFAEVFQSGVPRGQLAAPP